MFNLLDSSFNKSLRFRLKYRVAGTNKVKVKYIKNCASYRPFVANATMGIANGWFVFYQPFVANTTMGFADGLFVATNLLSLTRQWGSRLCRLFYQCFVANATMGDCGYAV